MSSQRPKHPRQLPSLFEQAVGLPLTERARFVEAVAADNPDLGARLDELLVADGSMSSGNFSAAQPLATPVGGSSVDNLDAEYDSRTGQRIEHYEVLQELGRGGMGSVYLARDTKLSRRVAIKFVDTDDPEMTRRFIDEARVTARCQHENIVIIHEVGEHDGRPYMVLEFLDGSSLRQRLQTGPPMTEDEALTTIRAVARALLCAHERGIIHRDLKPENIFLCTSGVIKVLDFGIAKALTDVPCSRFARAAALHTTMHQPEHARTQSRTLMGTLPYMAPEQWGTDDIRPSTDMWAVGIIFFEMLTGKHPLAPISYARLAGMVPDVETEMPDVGAQLHRVPRLAPIIAACLRKRHDARLPDARAFLDALANSSTPSTHDLAHADTHRPGRLTYTTEQRISERPGEPLTVMFLPANPVTMSQLIVRRELRGIEKRGDSPQGHAPIRYQSVWPTRMTELQRALMEHQPDIVHFVAGHGPAGFELRDDDGVSRPVPAHGLARLMHATHPGLRVIVLRGSFTPDDACAMAESIDAVVLVGSGDDARNPAGLLAAVYTALGFGHSLTSAVALSVAAHELAERSSGQELTVHTRSGVDVETVVLKRHADPSGQPAHASMTPALATDAVRLEFFELDRSQDTGFRRERITEALAHADRDSLDTLRRQLQRTTSAAGDERSMRARIDEWLPQEVGQMYLTAPEPGSILFSATIHNRSDDLVVLHTLTADFFHRGTSTLFSPDGYRQLRERTRVLAPLADYSLEVGIPENPMLPNLAVAPGDAASIRIWVHPMHYREFSMVLHIRGSRGVVLATDPFHVCVADDEHSTSARDGS